MGNGKRQSARLAAHQASKQATQLVPSEPRRTPPSLSSTTIHNLPLEIIGRIIAIAHPGAALVWTERAERYRFLKATSLVCREWTPFAQEQLWLGVSVFEEAAQSFREAGAGRYPTLRLNVHCEGTGNDIFETVLSEVRGVRDLVIGSGCISMDWLCGDNLKDVTTLRLMYATQSTSPASRPLPFNLTSLTLSLEEDPSSSPLINALSRQSSITSLVVITTRFDPTALIARLAPLASGLVTLELGVPGILIEEQDNFLKECSHLKEMTSRGGGQLESVRHLVVPLELWSISHIESDDMSSLLDILKPGLVATSKLERLILKWVPRPVRSSPRWKELVQRCRERKIEFLTLGRSGKYTWVVYADESL